ncbi:MAG: thiamine phosphate synthase [Nitrospinales bacterium]
MQTRLIKGLAEVKEDWLKVYLITNLSQTPPEKHLETVESALKGGIKDIQLREKNMQLDDLLSLAIVLRQMTERYEARLYINDRVDIAMMVEADGVHLPESGLPANEVKGRYPHLLVGVSTHSIESVLKAQENGADFVTFGPVFDTPSKRKYGPPQGLERTKEVTGKTNIPVLALGGIKLNNIPSVLETGVHGVGLISGIWNDSNIENVSHKYMQCLGGN